MFTWFKFRDFGMQEGGHLIHVPTYDVTCSI